MNGENSQLLGPGALRVLRTVMGMMFASLIWKAAYFVQFAYVYATLPLEDGFFPHWAQSSTVVAVAYLAAIFGAVSTFVTERRDWLFAQAVCAAAGVLVLCVHQGSYNDVTFLTAFWSALWCVWFSHRCAWDSTAVLLEKGSFLANIILAMILLGGGVGKWTAEYWSGAVFYDIYFVDRDFWVFNFLRSWFGEAGLREIACWYSRFVVVLESGCFVALWVLPRRWGAGLALLVFPSIALLSNLYLFSVLLSPMGLAMVGLMEAGKESENRGAKTDPNRLCKVDLGR